MTATLDKDGLYAEEHYKAPLREGYLEVSSHPPHRLFYQEYGNPDGQPVMVLHGGPGQGFGADDARDFNPDKYRIILFDQRGAGKSEPRASTSANTTDDLIDDINRMREHVGITGKMHVAGGSWGSTLALCYAIAHPENVKSLQLRGIFLVRRKDLDFFYQGNAADPTQKGACDSFPVAWNNFVEFIPPEERGDMVAAYHRRLFGADEAERVEAAKRWMRWEFATHVRTPWKDPLDYQPSAEKALPFSCIENHYFMNGIFRSSPDPETGRAGRDQNFILENIEHIAHIPTRIVQGRYDVVCPRDQADDLCKAWEQAQPDATKRPVLQLFDEGHYAYSGPMREAQRHNADQMLLIAERQHSTGQKAPSLAR